MNEEQYVEFCLSQLRLVFENTKAGRPDIVLKHRTEGLFKAAQLLNFLSPQDSAELIESEHQRVFGESVETRKLRKQAHQNIRESGVDDYFDVPTISRMNNERK